MTVDRARHRCGRYFRVSDNFADVHKAAQPESISAAVHFCSFMTACLHLWAAQSSDCTAPRSVCLHDGTRFPQKSPPPLFWMYVPVPLAAEPACKRYPANESRPRPPLPGATSLGSTVNARASAAGGATPKYTFASSIFSLLWPNPDAVS